MSSRAVAHNAGCHPALSHTALDVRCAARFCFQSKMGEMEANLDASDFIPRCRTQHRMSSCVVSHSAGFHPALLHTALDVECAAHLRFQSKMGKWKQIYNASDFIPRCRTQRRMSSRVVAHIAELHSALSHTALDFIPRCRTQRWIN